jgi:hypothetical protein
MTGRVVLVDVMEGRPRSSGRTGYAEHPPASYDDPLGLAFGVI